MLKKIDIEIPMFRFSLTVLMGSDKEYIKYMEKTDYLPPDLTDAGGHCSEYEPGSCILWVSEKCYLLHEISHASDVLLNHIGVNDNSSGTSELRAYFCGYVYDQILSSKPLLYKNGVLISPKERKCLKSKPRANKAPSVNNGEL